MQALLSRIEYLQKLWGIAVSGIPAPDNTRLLQWCGTFSDSEIEHALVRASNKVRKGDVVRTTEAVSRYVAGVLRNEAGKTRKKLERIIDRNQQQQAQRISADEIEASHG